MKLLKFTSFNFHPSEKLNVCECVRKVISPLLSNIGLNELDKELLEARGHRYVRYANDCSIHVKSEKSAERVMETITGYIETKLKLNRTKSKVSRPNESTLLGFSFYRSKGDENSALPQNLMQE